MAVGFQCDGERFANIQFVIDDQNAQANRHIGWRGGWRHLTAMILHALVRWANQTRYTHVLGFRLGPSRVESAPSADTKRNHVVSPPRSRYAVTRSNVITARGR